MAQFDGSEAGRIDLKTAKEMVGRWMNQQHSPDVVRAHLFGRNVIDEILAQPSCVGIRIYYALDSKDQKQLVIVGTDKDGNNIIPGVTRAENGDSGVIADISLPCPSYCPPNGDL